MHIASMRRPASRSTESVPLSRRAYRRRLPARSRAALSTQLSGMPLNYELTRRHAPLPAGHAGLQALSLPGGPSYRPDAGRRGAGTALATQKWGDLLLGPERIHGGVPARLGSARRALRMARRRASSSKRKASQPRTSPNLAMGSYMTSLVSDSDIPQAYYRRLQRRNRPIAQRKISLENRYHLANGD